MTESAMCSILVRNSLKWSRNDISADITRIVIYFSTQYNCEEFESIMYLCSQKEDV